MAEGSKFGPWNLSAEELRKITKWPDSVIEDYLYMQRQVATVTNNINVIIQQVTNNVTNDVQVQITNVATVQKNMQQQAEQNQSALSVLQAQREALQRNLAQLGEQVAGLTGPINRLAAQAANQQKALNALREENASLLGTVGRLQAQDALLSHRIANNEELLAGFM